MGERAQQAYEKERRAAFAALPWAVRLKANVFAFGTVIILAAMMLAYALRPLWAETVDVKYRGPVDLGKFQCSAALDGSLVKRVCYNGPKRYMLINLKGVWYHYCEIGKDTVDALLAASSKGSFYNASIKDSGTGGRFSCRDKQVPAL